MEKSITLDLESGVTVSAPHALVAEAVMERLARGQAARSFAKIITPLFTGIDAPEIGALWPGQGGYNGGYFPARGGIPGHYLIVSSLKDEPSLAFGGYDKKIEGADGKDDGAKNCEVLLATEHEHPAAKFCREYSEDGHKDYFLPARRQSLFLAATVPQLFKTDSWYWTSTRSSRNCAIVQDFDDGHQFNSTLHDEYLVRPVRRFFA